MPVAINSFPTQAELDRVARLRQFQQLYDLQHRPVLGLHERIQKQYKKVESLVYLSHAIPARVSEFYGDFVQGDETRLIIAAPGKEAKLVGYIDETVYENDLIEKVYDMGVEQSEFGFFVLHVWKDESDIVHIDLTPQDTFFPQADGSVVIAVYKRDTIANRVVSGTGFLLLTQEYKVVNGKCTIERKVWSTDERGVITGAGNKSRMETLIGRTIVDSETLDMLDVVPFVIVQNGRNKSGVGKSDYFDIMPQLAEVNERSTQVSTQFLKNIDAKLILPKSQDLIDDDGNIKEFDTLMLDGKDHATPGYVTNSNPLIESAMEFVLFQLKMISWITAVPMFELLKSAMPERVEALRIQLFAASRKTSTKRAKVKRGLKDALRIGAKLKGLDMQEDPIIEMSDVLPVDEFIEVQTEEIKVRSGLSSRKSAMKRVENYDDAQADAEITQIRAEDQIAGVADLNNPPTV